MDAGQGSPSRQLERRSPTRSRLPTPPHRRPASPNAAGADAGSAGLVSELDNTREGQEREPGTRGGERRALDNSSQWTVGIAEPGGAAAPPEPMVSLQQPQPRPKLSLLTDSAFFVSAAWGARLAGTSGDGWAACLHGGARAMELVAARRRRCRQAKRPGSQGGVDAGAGSGRDGSRAGRGRRSVAVVNASGVAE